MSPRAFGGRQPVQSLSTQELSALELIELRTLLRVAFDGDFSDDDWAHALGGRHFLATCEGAIVAHAAVVARELRIGERLLHSGYVEGVAVAEQWRRRGYGHSVVAQATKYITERFELGALSAAERHHGFYGRLGWRRWRGPTAVMVEGLARPTPEGDGGVMVLKTPTTGELDLDATLACDWRAGDVW